LSGRSRQRRTTGIHVHSPLPYPCACPRWVGLGREVDIRSTDVSGETVRGRSRRRYQSGGEAGAGAGSRWLAGAETGTALRQGFANQRVCRGYSRFGRRSRYPLCDLHVEPTTQWTGGVATPGSRRVIDGSSLPRGNSHSVRAGATSNAAVSRQRYGYLCSSTRTRAFPCPGTYRAWSSASPPTKAIGGSRNPTIRAGRGVSSQVVCGVRVPVAKPAGGGGCQPAASSSWPPRRGFMFSAIEQAPCRFDLSWNDLVREQATRSPPPRSLGFGIQVQHNHRVSSGAGCSSV